MKIKKETLTGIIVIIVIAVGIFSFYSFQKRRTQNAFASRIAELGGKGGPPPTIDGLRKAIAIYEEQIEAQVKTAAQTGIYWKILATRLQDRGLHNEALNALERGIYYAPEDPALQYMTGVSAAVVAKGYLDFSGSAPTGGDRYYDLAEKAFLKAIAMDGTLSRPRYALGVLYVFELNRPDDAIPQLIRYLEIVTNDVDCMFVLARAYYMTEQYAEALDLYDKIIAVSKDGNKRAEAERNRAHIMGSYYG